MNARKNKRRIMQLMWCVGMFCDKIVETPVSFTVARKKDGEVMGTFQSVREAVEMIEKARQQKKATLVLV